jgi:4-aminobutyrate aminotransferase-like enzyme
MALFQNGVLAVFADYRPSTVQIMPPLIIQPEEVDFVLQAMDRSCAFLSQADLSALPELALPIAH